MTPGQNVFICGASNDWNAIANAGASIDTDSTLSANSDTKVASQKATRAFVNAQIAASGITSFSGQRGGTVNYYVSTGGSDSNSCSSVLLPCLTLAHALSLIPAFVQAHYIVNVSDGTYGEPIDIEGFFGYLSGDPSIQIVGDVATPANVIFTGTVASCMNFKTAACVTNGFSAGISGVTLSLPSGTRNGVGCDHCDLILTATSVAGTFVCGLNQNGGSIALNGPISINGFSVADVSGTGGFGIDVINHGILYFTSGTTTLTGPGGTDTKAVGLVGEFGSTVVVAPANDSGSTVINLTVTGVQQGLNFTGGSTFASYVGTGTLSLSNTSTPTNSQGLNANAASINMTNNTLIISNFSTCVQAIGVAFIAHGQASRTTNCNVVQNAQQTSQITLF